MVNGSEQGEDPVSAAELLERLIGRLSASVSVTTVYGEPIERQGITIIPVAKAGFGFGAGAGTGRRRSETGRGGGGGGGAGATPYGYIEIKDGSAAFVPVRRPVREMLLPVAALAAGLVLAKALRRPSRG